MRTTRLAALYMADYTAMHFAFATTGMWRNWQTRWI